MIPVINENAKIKLALAIPISATITEENEAIEIPLLIADKAIKVFIEIVKGSNRFTNFFVH